MDEKGLLEKRLKRCIATILSYKEREIDRFLDDSTSAGLRKVILDEINEFHCIAVDLIENNVNEEYLDMIDILEDIHQVLVTKE